MIEEYRALRNEVLERIEILHSQTINTRGFVFSLWGVGFAVIALVLKDLPKTKDLFVLICFLSSLPFYVSLLLLVPASMKCDENATHIASISAYLRVFYECPSIISGKKEEFCYWEMGNGLVSMVFHGKKHQELSNNKNKPNRDIECRQEKKIFKLCELYNSEYFILGIVSTIFYYLASFGFIRLFFGEFGSLGLGLLLGLQLLLAIVAFVSLITIQRRSSVIKIMMSSLKRYIQLYLSLSVDLGINQKEDLASLWLKLDQNRPFENYFNHKNEVKG